MKRTDLAEAVAVLTALLTAIGQVPNVSTSTAAAGLRQALGALAAGAAAAIAGFALGAPLASIFTQLRASGASFAGVDAVRAQALAAAPVSALAGVVADAVMLQALTCQCRIVADLSFVSRDQVDAVRTTLDAAFDAAVDKAADAFDQVTLQALVTLRAAAMRDLAARARPLPQLVSYAFPMRRPALWIAQRLYADGSRYLELVAENNAVHPLFMPAAGRALSR